MEAKKNGHGGRRAGSGRKKGKITPGTVKRLTGKLPVALWDALTAAAKVARKRRSRYIDLLIAAVIRDEVDIDVDPNSLSPDKLAKWLALTNTRNVRGGYFSMRLQTWQDLQNMQTIMGWTRAMTLRNLFASQLILPPNERPRLDSLTTQRKPRQPAVVSENPFIYHPLADPQHPDDIYTLPDMAPEAGDKAKPTQVDQDLALEHRMAQTKDPATEKKLGKNKKVK